MVAILLAVVLQSAAPSGQSVELPVSLDRVRAGVVRPGRFDLPEPRPSRRPLFRTKVEGRMLLEGNAWDDVFSVPLWVRSPRGPLDVDFLQAVTAEEVRSSSVYPCCDVMPVVAAVNGFVSKRIQAVKQGRARREVEKAMRAAGIRK